jgi:C-terminal processing protease CtpA/Prc
VLTARLQQVNNDRHLRVRHRPDGAASRFDGAEHEARYAAEARENAGGVRQVRLFHDGIGLLEIAPYMSPVHLAEPYIRAAFTLLAAARGLVIDLRAGRGGTPETVALICGYLLGTEPVHLQDIEQRDCPPRPYWTAPAPTRLDGPVRVLVSHDTFSGCEELAYNLQALGRARIVGETTRGGAHPVESFAVSDVLELHLPIARSVNAITGTNWEQIGVKPDIPCAPADALDVALHDLTHP